jgi:O-antigen/teichoic acid export membrane protein
LGFVALLGAIAAALMLILKAAERPDLVFLSTAATCIVTLTAGTALVAFLGIPGIALALLLSTLTGTVLLGWYSRAYIVAVQRTKRNPILGGGANA